jgi:hypothetical protein
MHGVIKSPAYQFQQRLKNLKIKLKTWNKEIFGNILQAQEDLEKQMEEVQLTIIKEGRDQKEEFSKIK